MGYRPERVAQRDAEFRELTERHRRELTVHCYRMLGSLADAEDMLQETLLRAWQGLGEFEGRSSLRTWLYRIATNVCLDALAKKRPRTLPSLVIEAGDPRAPLPPPTSDYAWVEPLPDEWIEDRPDARYSTRESVALAFVAALQTLPERQRAVLLLRDVLGFSADETAEILEMSTAAANSALQRARETLEKQPPRHVTLDDSAARELCERFVRAWEAGDTGSIVALLREDAIFSMPPFPLWFHGRDAIQAFLVTLFAAGRRFRIMPARANAQPSLALYELEAEQHVLRALYVLSLRDGRITEIQAFLNVGGVLARFGLVEVL
jgi:RNA polymerase sigma-70 factor (ECF subfamily)